MSFDASSDHKESLTVATLQKALNHITISLISFLFLFSLFCICLIFYIRLLSQSRHLRLRTFATHSPSRLLLTTFATLWASVELLRFKHIPSVQLCNLHAIISLGLFQPGFLVSLLFIISTSIQSNFTPSFIKALSFIFLCCFPPCFTLYLTIYYLNTQLPLPLLFYQTVAFYNDYTGRKLVLCKYPLLGVVVFGLFGVLYSVALLFNCWKVISMAINKRLTSRINVLSFTILMCLALQVVLMSLSVFFTPMEAMYYLLVFLIFLNALVSVIVGESILIVIPIFDALSTVLITTNDTQEVADHV